MGYETKVAHTVAPPTTKTHHARMVGLFCHLGQKRVNDSISSVPESMTLHIKLQVFYRTRGADKHLYGGNMIETFNLTHDGEIVFPA